MDRVVIEHHGDPDTGQDQKQIMESEHDPATRVHQVRTQAPEEEPEQVSGDRRTGLRLMHVAVERVVPMA
jgi:hypothetical protein